jgi:hypothetical protein
MNYNTVLMRFIAYVVVPYFTTIEKQVRAGDESRDINFWKLNVGIWLTFFFLSHSTIRRISQLSSRRAKRGASWYIPTGKIHLIGEFPNSPRAARSAAVMGNALRWWMK